MSGEEWDADGFESKPFIAPRISDKWEGEDEDDDVKDNWDDDEEEGGGGGGGEQTEKKTEPLSETKAVQVKKKSVNKKIKEREEVKRKELEGKKQQENSTPQTPEELFEEKLRRQKLQEESDLELAKEAFGDVESSFKGGIDALEPSSKQDFDSLRKLLVEKLTKYEKATLYMTFLDDLLRDLCINLEADDIKRLGSTLNALSNEKVKAAKASKGKKKTGSSKRVNLVVGRPNDYGDYGDYGGDEFDDFM